MFFRYRNHLEAQVKELSEKIKDLESKNWELTKALIERPSAPTTTSSSTAKDILEKKQTNHKISTLDSTASCTCGWNFSSSDSGSLQNAIQEHHSATTTSLRARKSWATIRAKIESHSPEEILIKEN